MGTAVSVLSDKVLSSWEEPVSDLEYTYACGHGTTGRTLTLDERVGPCPKCGGTPILSPAEEAWSRDKEAYASEAAREFRQLILVSRFAPFGQITWHCEKGHPSFRMTIRQRQRYGGCKRCWREAQSSDQQAPGIAFARAGLRLPHSKAELEFRQRLNQRIRIPSGPNAISVSTRVHGHNNVWPDIIIPRLKIAIEYDDPGRSVAAHRGSREEADRAKDAALREVGWEVIRVRVGGLEAIGPWDIVTKTVNSSVMERVLANIRAVRDDEQVDAETVNHP